MPRTSIYREGFTLIEMIVVMSIISILAATMVVQMSATSARAAINQADQLRRNLSHIQMLALGWGVTLRLSTAADGKSYSVTCRGTNANTPCTTIGTVPADPATGQSFTVILTDNVLIAPTSNTVDFDSLGRPTSGGALIATNPVRTYTLTGNGASATVTLQPVTGFAEAS
ncbi:Tfp pilus assembly protein FimT/FimU [Noviherbaspirillum sp. UKPF54]|uniref:pilus assembly FimT family protein n=1 Tax=Noviherbaspirillum sp. UKPF54 TaxID=2601898 RepID=UPI0011B0FFDB|nr:prepilin-type N-terminal cleavage/methylation domain-containing protein [Noviherbaspirillum sp. UKPF54]QDZ28282.1 prepilin-type N-terminal cleavage/methylation domain-containing protein [Noviherbaspirillum sp. UKPF54]